jgi:hypothetical protein
MKRTLKVITVFSILMIFLTVGVSAQAYFFEMALDVSYLMHRDSNFKDVYGSGSILPELKLGIRLFEGLKVTGAFGSFKEDGTVVATTPGVNYSTEASQRFISAGLQYNFDVSWEWEFKISAEYVWVDYEEKVSAEEIQLVDPTEPPEDIANRLLNPSGTANAIRVGAGVVYVFRSNLFLEIIAAYTFGDDEVNGMPFDLGGFQAGVGIGFRL